MIKVTVDLNVILDFLNKRAGHLHAAQIVDLCAKKAIIGYLCAHEVTTLAYFLAKSDCHREKTNEVLNQMLDLFQIMPVTEKVLRGALGSGINDYEDAVIEFSSLAHGVHYIITCNLSDFKRSAVKALSPAEFLALKEIN